MSLVRKFLSPFCISIFPFTLRRNPFYQNTSVPRSFNDTFRLCFDILVIIVYFSYCITTIIILIIIIMIIITIKHEFIQVYTTEKGSK